MFKHYRIVVKAGTDVKSLPGIADAKFSRNIPRFSEEVWLVAVASHAQMLQLYNQTPELLAIVQLS